MTYTKNRRPIKSRGIEIFQTLAVFLNKKNITPNQISIASVIFAFFSGFCLIYTPKSQAPLNWLLPLLSAFFIQMRLLCNLLDGIVAVEGGKATASGELFNELPDRVADLLILVSAGYAAKIFECSPALGWCAGSLAILTAYIRALSTSLGVPPNFSGPMAKPHRMAAMTIACIVTSLEGLIEQQGYALTITLLIIIVGSIITSYRRMVFAYRHLENKRN